MNWVFFARHGAYSEESGNLTSEGRNQIEDLSCLIKKIIRNDSLYIVSSPIKRAKESSLILRENLPGEGVDFKYFLKEINFDYFFGDNSSRGGSFKIKELSLALVKKYSNFPAVLFMGHQDTIPCIANYFFDENKIEGYNINGFSFGQAVYLNMLDNKWGLLPDKIE